MKTNTSQRVKTFKRHKHARSLCHGKPRSEWYSIKFNFWMGLKRGRDTLKNLAGMLKNLAGK